MDIIELSSDEFLTNHGMIYQKVFGISDNSVYSLSSYQRFRKKKFYVLSDGKSALAFFSLREIKPEFFELGDVCKIAPIARQTFSDFLRKTIIQKNIRFVVGLPNDLAIKMELLAGFEIIKKFHKQLIIIMPFLCIYSPIVKTKAGISLNFNAVKFSRGVRFEKCLTRKFCKNTKNGSLIIFGLSLNFIEAYEDGYDYISWQGVGHGLLNFSDSDNSF